MVPTGLGNSATNLDLSIIGAKPSENVPDILDDSTAQEIENDDVIEFPGDQVSEVDKDSDVEDVPTAPKTPNTLKRSLKSEVKGRGSAKKSKTAEFNEVAIAEESTRRSQIELAKTRVMVEKESRIELEKIKLKRDEMRFEGKKMKAELWDKQANRKHEYRLARLSGQVPDHRSNYHMATTSHSQFRDGPSKPQTNLFANFGAGEEPSGYGSYYQSSGSSHAGPSQGQGDLFFPSSPSRDHVEEKSFEF